MKKNGFKSQKKPKRKFDKSKIKRAPNGDFLPGTAPGPGRPPGSLSIMGSLKAMWEKDPKDFAKFVKEIRHDKFMRKEIVQQIDGKPKDRIELSGIVGHGEFEGLSNDELIRLAKES